MSILHLNHNLPGRCVQCHRRPFSALSSDGRSEPLDGLGGRPRQEQPTPSSPSSEVEFYSFAPGNEGLSTFNGARIRSSRKGSWTKATYLDRDRWSGKNELTRVASLWSRVGKGRPAGSIELRVSPSPSRIPYGGFSPVRLQMDRQWRPSTTSPGLSAVHIRPMNPVLYATAVAAPKNT